MRPVHTTPTADIRQEDSRRLKLSIMPRHSKYRDTSERIEHYNKLRRWDRTIQVPPNTTELREIRDIQHFYHGLPVTSFMCLPGAEGVDKKPSLGEQAGGRQPDNQQPRRTAPIFGNGRQQHGPRSYSSWYRSVVGLERMVQVPELRTEEGGPSREESERDHEARGRERRLGELRRQRRQRWRWVTAQASQE